MTQFLSGFGRAGRIGLSALALWFALLTAGAVMFLVGDDTPSQEQAISGDVQGWGGEALATLSDNAQRLSPVALANACGLGASSCFRCHNGKRAASPSSDAVTAPWHLNHATVNYSCAGCHQGNPRILKQEIAHKDLIANPVTAPEKSCAGCHAASEIPSLVGKYRQPHAFLNLGN